MNDIVINNSSVWITCQKTVKDRKEKLKDVMHWLLDNGSINTTHEMIDKHK